MSKIIPPMISSSPPPMDDTVEEDDDDDEFGSFSSANYSYSLDLTQPSKIPAKVDWEGSVKNQFNLDNIHEVKESKQTEAYNNVTHHNGTHSSVHVLPDTFLTEEDDEVAEAFPRDVKDVSSNHEMQQDNTSQDSVASVATDSGLCSASQESDGPSPLPTVKGLTTSLQVSDNVSQDDSSSSEETLVKSYDADHGVHFTANLEVVDDAAIHLSDNTFVKSVNVLKDLDQDRCSPSSKQVTDNDENQLSVMVDQEFTNTSMKDVFSDYQSVTIDSESNVSVGNSCIHSNKISDQKHEHNSLDKECEEFHVNNTFNLVGPDSEINNSNESRRHLCSNIDATKESDCRNVMHSSFASKVLISDSLTISKENFLSDSDKFADFAVSEVQVPPPSLASVIQSNESCDSDDEFSDFTSCNVQISTSASPECIIPQTSTDDLDKTFADFTSCNVGSSVITPLSAVITPNTSGAADDEFTDFTSSDGALPHGFAGQVNNSGTSYGSESEFADFASGTEISYKSVEEKDARGWVDEAAIHLHTVAEDVNQMEDDFDDFESASFSSTPVTSVTDHSQLTTRLENVVTTLFPGPALDGLDVGNATVLPSGLIVDRNTVWSDLRDVDTSHALSYQWGNSSANKMLLSSLGIDTRNILFGAKWNVSVPRFAANLGISPLEPVRAHSSPLQPHRESKSSSSTQPELSTASGPEATVPDAQFDWISSGLVNPLDCEEKDGGACAPSSQRAFDPGQQLLTAGGAGGRRGLSTEAVKVLDSLPDLSFLRTRVLVFPASSQALTQ